MEFINYQKKKPQTKFLFSLRSTFRKPKVPVQVQFLYGLSIRENSNNGFEETQYCYVDWCCMCRKNWKITNHLHLQKWGQVINNPTVLRLKFFLQTFNLKQKTFSLRRNLEAWGSSASGIFCMNWALGKVLAMENLRKHNIAMLTGVACVGRVEKLLIICIFNVMLPERCELWSSRGPVGPA